MIDKQSGRYHLVCDVCGEEAEETFDGFYDAVEYKKQEGWKSQHNGSEWQDVCPDCQGK